MKLNRLYCALTVALAMTSATDIVADILSPQLRLKAQSLISKNHDKSKVAARESQRMEVMVSTDGLTDTEELASCGFMESHRLGGIVIGSIAVDSLSALRNVKVIKRVDVAVEEQPFLNLTRREMGVDAVHEGLSNDVSDVIPYSGKGVVIGIVDSGIDPNHLAYRTSWDGERKVSKYMMTEGARESINGSLTVHTYDTPEAISAAPIDRGASGHGTHTTGIASGSYKDNVYYGIAPDAELVLTSMGNSLYSDEITYGVASTFDYAESVGKPAVVNLSLGGTMGTHRGDNYITDIMEGYSPEGKILCVAAGNDGVNRVSLQHDFSLNSKELVTGLAKTFYGTPALNSDVVISSKEQKPFTMALTVIDTQNRKEVWRSEEIKHYPEEIGEGYAWTLLNSKTDECEFPDMAFYMLGEILLVADNAPQGDGLSEVRLMVTLTSADRYAVGLAVTSSDGADVLLTTDASYSYFYGFHVSGYETGNPDNSISELCTSPYALSVGAWNARRSWTDTDGGLHYMNTAFYGPVGEIGNYSSYGVMRDGTDDILPHIVAPGTCIMSSVLANSAVNDVAAVAYDSDGKEYCWGENSGTSMACPATAGVVALWLEADPSLTLTDVLDVMEHTSLRDAAVNKRPDQTRYGKLDAYEGLKYILQKNSSIGAIESNRLSGLMMRFYGNESVEITLPFTCSGGEMSVYSIDGSRLLSQSFSGQTSMLDIAHLPKGIYVLRADTPQGVASAKFVLR